jgi:'Cold-shock' DNA-binding domain
VATGTVKWFNTTKGYGFIQPDGGGLGGSEQTAHEMVRAGWLVRRGGRYEITPVGLQVLELEPTR